MGPLTAEGGVYVSPFVCQWTVVVCAVAGAAHLATEKTNWVFAYAIGCLGLVAIFGAAHVLIAGLMGLAKRWARWRGRPWPPQ